MQADVPGDPGLAARFRDWAGRCPPNLTHADAIPLLFEVAKRDLGLARLGEAHIDGLLIAYEARHEVPVGRTFAVWASDGPSSRVVALREGQGWRVEGMKQYCTGAGIVTDALVTAHGPGGLLLFRLDVSGLGERADASVWKATAFAETATANVRFDELVSESACLGGVGWYLSREGFWDGAIRVAAAWAGGAAGLVDLLQERRPPRDPHGFAHLGALRAAAWDLESVVRAAAELAPRASGELAAARIRAVVAERCETILARAARAAGPGLLAFDEDFSRRFAELQLYIRQHHGEADLERLGRLELDRAETTVR